MSNHTTHKLQVNGNCDTEVQVKHHCHNVMKYFMLPRCFQLFLRPSSAAFECLRSFVLHLLDTEWKVCTLCFWVRLYFSCDGISIAIFLKGDASEGFPFLFVRGMTTLLFRMFICQSSSWTQQKVGSFFTFIEMKSTSRTTAHSCLFTLCVIDF